MVILIDNGHGKDTAGKNSPLLKDSGVVIDYTFVENGRFKEWLYTRVVAKDVVDILKWMGYDARLLVTEEKDISLSERVKRINKVCSEEGAGNVLMISVHANAAGNGTSWMSARGWCAYTTRGQNNSDKLAEFLYDRASKNFDRKDLKLRKDTSDGDSDWEADFYIIKHANCPAVLTENFFYDNKEDLKYLTSDEGLHCVARTHVEGILDFIESKKKK